MLSLYYRDNPVELLKKFRAGSSGGDYKSNVEALHEELVEWFVDNEELIKNSSPEISRSIGGVLSNAGSSISRGSYDRTESFYSQLLRELEELHRQIPFLKQSKKKLDRFYDSWKNAVAPKNFFVSEEFVHLLKKLEFQELSDASRGIAEIQKYHDIINSIATGGHSHHETPHSLKFYPKSNLWGVRCGNKHELLIFFYDPKICSYNICDYIDRHTHDEADSHRGRYYEIFAIGSRTVKTYNFRGNIFLSKRRSEGAIIYPFELMVLKDEELDTLGV